MLKAGHGAQLHLHEDHPHHHHHGEDGVKVKGDGLDEQGQAAAVLHVAGHRRRPGGDGGDDAHRRRRGVDEVRQLGPGELVLVGDGLHHRAHGKAVEIVVDEDQHPQGYGGQLGPHPGFDVLGRPAAKGGGAPGLVHQADHGPQDHQEHQDTNVVAIRQHADNAVLKHMEDGALKGVGRVEQAAHQGPYEQGGVHLLGNQGQGNGHHRGQQRPGGAVEPAALGGTLPAVGGQGEEERRQQEHRQQPSLEQFRLSHTVPSLK